MRVHLQRSEYLQRVQRRTFRERLLLARLRTGQTDHGEPDRAGLLFVLSGWARAAALWQYQCQEQLLDAVLCLGWAAVQATSTATATAASTTAAAVRGVQPDDVLWYSLCLEHDNTWVHRSPSASAGATEDGLAAVLLRRGLHMRTLQSEREYLR